MSTILQEANAHEAPAGATDPVALAHALAEAFRPGVVERERAGEAPREELARLRETGLVNLHIPVEYGGGGGDWRQLTRVIFELSKVDPNIGALLAYHYHNFVAPTWDPYGNAEAIQRRSAENNWLWGHVTAGPLLTATPQPDGGFVLNGSKPQNTGPGTGDVTTVYAHRTDRREGVHVFVPTDREGITYQPAWDLLGFRRTETQAITFANVRVAADEVQPNTTDEPIVGFPPFYVTTGWLAFGAIYVGAAWGALETAREYLRDRQRAPHGYDAATAEPITQALYGNLWIKAQAILAFQDAVAAHLDEVLVERAAARQDLLPDREVALAAHATAFRVRAGRTALEIANRVYDGLGGGAIADPGLGLDRFWRDVRTHSLHAHTYVYDDTAIGAYLLDHDITGLRPNLFG